VSAGFVNADSKEELLSLFGDLRDKAITMINTDKVWAEPARFTARAQGARLDVIASLAC
jgi:para-nitrobenzyl esterase